MNISESNNTTLPFDILHDFRRQGPLLRHAQLRRKRRMRDPASRCPWCGLLEHLVDLFEGKTFGFGHEEVGVYEAGGAKGAPEEEHFGLKVCFVRVDKVGRDDGDDLYKKRRMLE